MTPSATSISTLAPWPGGSGWGAGSCRALTLAGRLAHGIEPVARAAHRHDLETQLPETAQLLPEPADVDVDRLAVAQGLVAPDLLEQDLAREEPTRPRHHARE